MSEGARPSNFSFRFYREYQFTMKTSCDREAALRCLHEHAAIPTLSVAQLVNHTLRMTFLIDEARPLADILSDNNGLTLVNLLLLHILSLSR